MSYQNDYQNGYGTFFPDSTQMLPQVTATQQSTKFRLQWRGFDDDEMPPRRNAWGGFFPVVLGGEWGNERERERSRASALSGRP